MKHILNLIIESEISNINMRWIATADKIAYQMATRGKSDISIYLSVTP